MRVKGVSKIYRIAIVEDDRVFVKELQQYLEQYAQENGEEFDVELFCDGAEVLENYAPKYDLILLDIKMPKVNGMDAAEKIREADENVVLMFITNMAQYAIRGYSVGALDFVMKPITYYTFSMKIKRALKRVQKKELPSILLTLPNGVKKLEVRQIYYVEVQNRMLYYHTDEGEYVVRASLQSAENTLPSDVFAKCNHWYLVNLMHVTEVRKNTVIITGSDGLPQFENDPVAVAAMREACHHNLYAIANSQAMNGIGADTTIKEIEPKIVTAARVGAIAFSALFVVSLVMWIVKVNIFKKTDAYATYKEFKKSLKNK